MNKSDAITLALIAFAAVFLGWWIYETARFQPYYLRGDLDALERRVKSLEETMSTIADWSTPFDRLERMTVLDDQTIRHAASRGRELLAQVEEMMAELSALRSQVREMVDRR